MGTEGMKAVVTEALVSEVAEQMCAEGREPSILTVQARIGGGSFSTVKKHLDRWREKKREEHAAPETPGEINRKAQEFARAVWGLAYERATSAADLEVKEIRRQLEIANTSLAEAAEEIARLEKSETVQRAETDKCHARIRKLEITLAEAMSEAKRASDIERRLIEKERELDACRKEAAESAVRAGELYGIATALRERLRAGHLDDIDHVEQS